MNTRSHKSHKDEDDYVVKVNVSNMTFNTQLNYVERIMSGVHGHEILKSSSVVRSLIARNILTILCWLFTSELIDEDDDSDIPFTSLTPPPAPNTIMDDIPLASLIRPRRRGRARNNTSAPIIAPSPTPLKVYKRKHKKQKTTTSTTTFSSSTTTTTSTLLPPLDQEGDDLDITDVVIHDSKDDIPKANLSATSDVHLVTFVPLQPSNQSGTKPKGYTVTDGSPIPEFSPIKASRTPEVPYFLRQRHALPPTPKTPLVDMSSFASPSNRKRKQEEVDKHDYLRQYTLLDTDVDFQSLEFNNFNPSTNVPSETTTFDPMVDLDWARDQMGGPQAPITPNSTSFGTPMATSTPTPKRLKFTPSTTPSTTFDDTMDFISSFIARHGIICNSDGELIEKSSDLYDTRRINDSTGSVHLNNNDQSLIPDTINSDEPSSFEFASSSSEEEKETVLPSTPSSAMRNATTPKKKDHVTFNVEVTPPSSPTCARAEGVPTLSPPSSQKVAKRFSQQQHAPSK